MNSLKIVLLAALSHILFTVGFRDCYISFSRIFSVFFRTKALFRDFPNLEIFFSLKFNDFPGSV